MSDDGRASPDASAQKSQEREKSYDLTERTAKLGETVIRFARTVKLDAVSSPLVAQLVRAATSVGANYCEAQEAASRKEFHYRISLCNREAREAKHWLRMLAAACPHRKAAARRLWKETNELNLILSAIFRKTKPAR
jgi:four helix bundle protein